jgi:hypothetical protein
VLSASVALTALATRTNAAPSAKVVLPRESATGNLRISLHHRCGFAVLGWPSGRVISIATFSCAASKSGKNPRGCVARFAPQRKRASDTAPAFADLRQVLRHSAAFCGTSPRGRR